MNSEHCINLVTFKQQKTLLPKVYIGLMTDNHTIKTN
jgi:hypothetical protein